MGDSSSSNDHQIDNDDENDDEYQYWSSKIELDPKELYNAPESILSNNTKRIVLPAIQKYGLSLISGSPELRNNKQVVMDVVKNWGYALAFVSSKLRNDKQVVMVAVQKDGLALKYASPSLQKDKDVALAAVQQNPHYIIYVHEDIKRDPDILIAAGMFDEDHYDHDHQDATERRRRQQQRKIALSTRFSLNEASGGSESTNFTALFKKSKFYKDGNFLAYAPNAFDKKTCDPEWTNFNHPCRGTIDTCQFDNELNNNNGRPTDNCCWRYSFRSQLQEAKDTDGFMLQLVETGFKKGKVEDATLGMGQTIELDMANTIGTKVFQVYRPPYKGCGYDEEDRFRGVEWSFEQYHIGVVTEEISRWYNDNNQCHDMSVTVIRFPLDLDRGDD